MKILIILLLLCSTAYAETNLLVSGYDYVLMNDSQKTKLVDSLLMILKQDRARTEDTVVALDELYYIYSHEVENKDAAIKAVFDKPVMQLLAKLLTMKAPTSYDEEMLRKYGLTLKK